VLDFTSALYLGLEHPSTALRPWSKLTTGVPAALAETALARSVAARIADLVGCERALLAPSTFHLFWDLFGTAAFRYRPIFLDAGTYAIARWGVERAAAYGATISRFAHYDARALRSKLNSVNQRGPVVVCDGFCPGCGKAAPIQEYAAAAAPFGGTLLIDDTQALGILGERHSPETPYGAAGGGVLRWSGIADPNVLAVSSLAKGFGVPVAVLAGCRKTIDTFEEESETRVHCSPPSAAMVHAAEHALDVNEREGDKLRLRLASLVWRFKRRLSSAGITTQDGLFPVQSLNGSPRLSAMDLHESLLRSGVTAVLHKDRRHDRSKLSFLINARHTPGDVDAAVDAVCKAGDERELRRRRVARPADSTLVR
jgi:8-amino-7-oxononanoate synthase